LQTAVKLGPLCSETKYPLLLFIITSDLYECTFYACRIRHIICWTLRTLFGRCGLCSLWTMEPCSRQSG